jgi:multicomponent Na+:H+ antiporter subunit G
MSDIGTVRDAVAVVLVLAGAFLCLTAGLGLVRFPDVLTRMHAGTKPQILGILLIMIGGAIRLEGWSATWMLLLVAAFQLLTAPVSAHMVSRVAYRRRHIRRDLLLVDELRTGEAADSVYRGDEPADAPPERPAESLVRSRREDAALDDGPSGRQRPPS